MIKRTQFCLLLLFLSLKIISQETDYIRPQRKNHYNVFASFPSTRSFGYNAGVEITHKTNENISFASSVGGSLVPVNRHNKSKSFFFSLFVQPIHIIVGKKKVKFESGISISYLDYNLTNNPNTIPSPADKIFATNLFIGGRYNPTEKFALHLGYLPRYIIGGNKNYFKKFFHGLELSIFYSLN